jgi:feruloyl esterase
MAYLSLTALLAAQTCIAGPGPQNLWQLPIAAPGPTLAQTHAVRPCESLLKSLPGAGVVRAAVTIPASNGAGAWCRVTIEIHEKSDHPISVWLALPIENWNGRFLGLGGAGWVAGLPFSIPLGSSLGFATATTNAGREYDANISPEVLSGLVDDDTFLRDAKGHLDWDELRNFAYRGVHAMTVAGKAVTAEFYGAKARYAYFSGCSTGGQQGQAEVQRYPDDYDGVMSGAPAINWAHIGAAQSWSVAVMRNTSDVPQCKLDAAQRAAVAACATDDGLKDGLVAQVGTCHFDPSTLIGLHTDCGTIDAQDAEVIRQLWDGPRRANGSPLWNGTDRAAVLHSSTSALWLDQFEDEGRALEVPSLARFESQFDRFVNRYGPAMDTSDPDLRAFAAHGGKTILWHGVADDVIPAAGTVHYVQSIQKALGTSATDKFLRLYEAPGVLHCQGGEGPQPVDLLEPLMMWVEHGQAPTAGRSENWDAGGHTARTRPLCPYPTHARFNGQGNESDASSFSCVN